MAQQYGNYELIERIARGGMAEVFKARMKGAAGFEKLVALKMLHAHLAEDAEMVASLKDEARLVSNMLHPNICQVLYFEKIGDRYCITMEYIHGRDVATIMRTLRKTGQKMPLEFALYIIRQTLTGLDYAHRMTDPTTNTPLNIIHRDISPQNVLVDRSGTVKVCDFGIATGPWREERTRTGIVKGKVGYMAPEQAAGSRVGPQADLYSVGLLLVAMLEGSHPFEGSDTEEIRRKARQGLDPDRLARLPGGEALREVITTALAPRPKDRFPTAEAMRRALREAVPDREEQGVRQLVQIGRASCRERVLYTV